MPTAEGELHSTASNFTMSYFKEYIANHWHSKHYQEDSEELHFRRFAVAAKTPSGVVHIKEPKLDGDVIKPTTECVVDGKGRMYILCQRRHWAVHKYILLFFIIFIGYKQRSMEKMVSCWSDVMKQQTWLKYMDNSGVCPFHWVHRACMRYIWKKRPREMNPRHVMVELGAGAHGGG